MDDAVKESYLQVEAVAKDIHERLQAEVNKLGFGIDEVQLKEPFEAWYRLEPDPASGKKALKGDWIDEKGAKLGSLVFNIDGSFFVEQDIVRPHPKKPGWFVEAVNAWGREGIIKAEAKLLRMPE